jgi:YVTN family beta-propeller protein
MPHFAIAVGDKVFVSNYKNGNVTVIARPNHEVVGTITVGAGPLGASATRDGKRVYFACHISNHVAVIDTEALKVVARVPTEASPVQVTVVPSQKHAYVTTDGRGTVEKIDLSENKVVKRISLGADAGSHGIGFAAGGKLVLVTNTGTNTVSVINAETDEVIQTIRVRGGPEGIAYKRP